MKWRLHDLVITIAGFLWFIFMWGVAVWNYPARWPVITIVFLGVLFSAIADCRSNKCKGGIDGLPAVFVPWVWLIVVICVTLLWLMTKVLKITIR